MINYFEQLYLVLLNLQLAFLHLAFGDLFHSKDSSSFSVVPFKYFSKRTFSYKIAHSIKVTEFDLFACLLDLAHPYLSLVVIREVKDTAAHVTQSNLDRIEYFDW